MYRQLLIITILISFAFASCKKDERITRNETVVSTQQSKLPVTPYSFNYPQFWIGKPIAVPANNPMTMEGVALGRKLFYDPVLSENGTMSCATCHNIAYAFTDNGKKFSSGLHGELGTRNAPPVFNLGWVTNYGVANYRFFWDGGAPDLESQALGPITNPIEMNETLFNVVKKLRSHPEYPSLFKKAFGTDSITSQLLVFAIAQFERTIISGSSKFDKGRLINFSNFTPQEANGMDVFMNENKGDCWHCHSLASGFFTDFQLRNNGIISPDSGLGRITNNPADFGKFKTPSLRNLIFTFPYMHDGRFQTLEQVIDFYDSQAYLGTNADPFITKQPHPNGLSLSNQDKKDLVSFLLTLTDSVFINSPEFSKP